MNGIEKLKKLLDEKQIVYRENEVLSKHSGFKIGGAARLGVFPENAELTVRAIEYASQSDVRYTVIGNGSNVFFSDAGYDGAIIFTSAQRKIEYRGDRLIYAECGASFTYLSSVAKKHSLTGLEFAYGIPGTVGGAIYMNAGAFGGECSDVLERCTVYNISCGKIEVLTKDECELSYRCSKFSKTHEYVILSAEFRLADGEETAISEKMDSNMKRRADTQPLEYPSAGSTFKRPEGLFAAKLIDDCGLKGTRVGDACVSEKHAGFVVNIGSATSDDVLGLIEIIKEKVFSTFGVMLECEVIYIS